MPKESNWPNPEFGKYYSTDDPVSSSNKWYEKGAGLF